MRRQSNPSRAEDEMRRRRRIFPARAGTGAGAVVAMSVSSCASSVLTTSRSFMFSSPPSNATRSHP